MVNLNRLCWAMQRARLSLRRYRANRREMVREYVGQWWSEEGADREVPINLLSIYIQVVARNLVSHNPRVSLTTFDKRHQPVVAAAETWVNQEIPRMKLAGTLKRIVLDALFSVGICKVALATPADAASFAWKLQAGRPFAERVDLDDFVFDVHARDFAEVGFIGHRLRVPLAAVKESPLYSRARQDLVATPVQLYNQEGDERIDVMGKGTYSANSEEFEDHVDLWEVYLPQHRLVLTLADEWLAGAGGGEMGNDEPLRTVRWLGPDEGPYHTLGFLTVPGNAMPLGPLQHVYDLHLLMNNIFRKLSRQSERQKELLLVAGGHTEDGERIIKASDGDAIRVDNPAASKLAMFGGPNQPLLAMEMQTWDLFNRLAGNLEMMGGLGPQSKTLGQDQLLAQNASGAVADKQEATVDFTSRVVSALLWYWWKDPFRTMSSKFQVPGVPELALDRHVSPLMRSRVPFEALDLRVDPYSLQHQSPAQRLAFLDQTIQQLAPLMPVLMQQGVMLDAHAYLQKKAKYADEPDLPDIFTIQEPPQPSSQAPPGPPGGSSLPPETTRNYVRHSQGGASRYGRDVGMLNTMTPPGRNGAGVETLEGSS